MLAEQIAHGKPHVGGLEAPLLQRSVFALADGIDYGRIRTGPSYPVLFQLSNESSLCEPRRRLGMVLLRNELDEG